jgi:nitrogen regulatory protein PII
MSNLSQNNVDRDSVNKTSQDIQKMIDELTGSIEDLEQKKRNIFKSAKERRAAEAKVATNVSGKGAQAKVATNVSGKGAQAKVATNVSGKGAQAKVATNVSGKATLSFENELHQKLAIMKKSENILHNHESSFVIQPTTKKNKSVSNNGHNQQSTFQNVKKFWAKK